MKGYIAVLTLALCFSTQLLQAQTYKNAIGVRIDNRFSLSAKQRLVNKLMLEGILHTPMLSHDAGVSLLLERHRKLISRNISIYYGGGAHYYWRNEDNNESVQDSKIFGATAIGGLDLCIGRLNLSVDIAPELHFAGEAVRPFEMNGVSVSARYILNKQARTKLRDRIHIPKRKQGKQGKKRSFRN